MGHYLAGARNKFFAIGRLLLVGPLTGVVSETRQVLTQTSSSHGNLSQKLDVVFCELWWLHWLRITKLTTLCSVYPFLAHYSTCTLQQVLLERAGLGVLNWQNCCNDQRWPRLPKLLINHMLFNLSHPVHSFLWALPMCQWLIDLSLRIFKPCKLVFIHLQIAMRDSLMVSSLFSQLFLLITLSNSGFSCRIYARRQDPGMNQGWKVVLVKILWSLSHKLLLAFSSLKGWKRECMWYSAVNWAKNL